MNFHRTSREEHIAKQAQVVFHKLKHLQTGDITIHPNLISVTVKNDTDDALKDALNELAMSIVGQQSTLVSLEENVSDGKLILTAKLINFKFNK